MNKSDKLKEYAVRLADDSLLPGEAKAEVDSWYEFLLSTSGILRDNLNETEDTSTKYGKAVSPELAAFCLTDYRRTVQFIRAAQTAIRDILESGVKKIEVLYAGTGPYAPMFTAVAPLFSPEEVQFTLLDIHQVTLDSLDSIVDEYGLRPYVKEVVCADATEYICDVPPNLILSETMASGLNTEPQVAMSIHLYSQLAKDGILIPENVTLSVVQRNNSDLEKLWIPESYTLLGTAFELADCVRRTNGLPREQNAVVGTAKLTLNKRQGLELHTTLDIYKDIRLLPGESSLTLPRPIRLEGKSAEVDFEYVIGDRPSLRWSN